MAAAASATTARAWVFTDTATPQALHELALPADSADLPAGSLLVRLRVATLCGSDVHTIDGKRIDPAAPLVLGHEGVGVVAAFGPGAHTAYPDLDVGARVTWSVATSCGACRPCSQWDLPQKCTSVKKYGHAAWAGGRRVDGLAGTYASHILLTTGSAVVRLPDAVPDALASPVNCALATMVNAVLNSSLLARRRDGSGGGGGGGSIRSALVQGAGMLGLYGVALLKHALSSAAAADGDGGGAPPPPPPPPFVAVTDVADARLEAARRFGADAVVNTAGRDDADVAAQLLGALAAHEGAAAPAAGFDLVVEVCGTSAVVPLAVRLLRPGGEVVLVGQVHPNTPLAGLTGDAVIRKCALLRGVHNYAPGDLRRAVAFLADTVTALPYDELVSPPLPLEQLPAALELARSGRWARVSLSM
jgi:threonine dehydrogenase-like Zn-dependent dehydrogenase